MIMSLHGGGGVGLLVRLMGVTRTSVIASQFRSASNSYEFIKTDKRGAKKNVGLVTLDRPQALNALCKGLLLELSDAVAAFDRDATVGAIVLTGSQKAFAAGADIKEMLDRTFADSVAESFVNEWRGITECKKPVLAAVNGYVLGGGCELAMMCDIVYAGDEAKFGQPEITIGTIPGAGGTQRMAKSVGKSKAMELCLTGQFITADEAEKMGLVSRVVPADSLVDETVKLAEKIAAQSPIIVQLCKECINIAFETTLQEGLRFERRAHFGTFATLDRKEGMTAFLEKRAPIFKNE